MLSAPTTPATAMPTITMKTISSTSDIPCSARGRWRRAWRSAMHIPRFGLDHDLPRRVVGDGAGQGDGHQSVGNGAPQAVEAEAGAGAARERDTGGRLLGLQGCARNRVRDGCGGAVAVRGRADRGRRHAHVDWAPPRNRRFLCIAHDGLRFIVEAARGEALPGDKARGSHRDEDAHDHDRHHQLGEGESTASGGPLQAHYCALVGERAIGVAKSDWQAWTWQAPAENSRRNGTVTPVQVTALLGAGPPSRLPTSVAQVAALLYVRPTPMLG